MSKHVGSESIICLSREMHRLAWRKVFLKSGRCNFWFTFQQGHKKTQITEKQEREGSFSSFSNHLTCNFSVWV